MFCVGEKKVNCGEMENASYVVWEMVICNLSGIWTFALNKIVPWDEEIAMANAYEGEKLIVFVENDESFQK